MICFRKTSVCFRYSQKHMHATENQNQLRVIWGMLVCQVKMSSIVLFTYTKAKK